MGALKVVAWVIGGLAAIFIAMLVYEIQSEYHAKDQALAAKGGLSMRECIDAMKKFGTTEGDGRARCEERVPK